MPPSAPHRDGEAPLTVQFTDLSDPGSAPNHQLAVGLRRRKHQRGSRPLPLVHTARTLHRDTRCIHRRGKRYCHAGKLHHRGAEARRRLHRDTHERRRAFDRSLRRPVHPGSSEITTWAWDFGDGTSSSQQNPSKTYAQPGVYTVKLTVTSAAGTGTITKANHITVRQLPSTRLTSNVTTGSAPLTVLFADESTSGSEALTGWQWDFGDGTSGRACRTQRGLRSPGIYTVSLTASSSVGSDTKTKSAYLTVRPAVNFRDAHHRSGKPLRILRRHDTRRLVECYLPFVELW